MFYTLLIVVHVVTSILLIVIILMQSAKGEGLSGAFGMGSGTTSLFGADTATVLTKGTVVLAVIFAVTCRSIAVAQIRRGKSQVAFDKEPVAQTQLETAPSAEGADTATQDIGNTGETPDTAAW